MTNIAAALYAACLAGNVTEQLWNFTWPAAIATLHPSLLPVAVLGFFSKVRLRHACSACHTHSLQTSSDACVRSSWCSRRARWWGIW